MDADYWKTRCAAAEDALQRARRGLTCHPGRRALLAALGELKDGESIETSTLAQELRLSLNRCWAMLQNMERVGLVERTPKTRCGGRGHFVRWRLGHMVQIEAGE